MEIYKAGSKWVLGLERASMDKEPEAIILKQRPIPLRMFKPPVEVRENIFKSEYWEYSYVFFEYSGELENTYFLQIEYRRREPGFIYGIEEHFVTKEEVKKKIDELKRNNHLALYHWSINECTWIEIERGFKYEDELEDEMP